MSDASVAAALRSPAPLVVVEAPAGCGKTFQGAEYARDIAPTLGRGRALIVTHTHAACDVFASRTAGLGRSVEIRTIDSLIAELAAAYHPALGIPADAGAWARRTKNGYGILAAKAAKLIRTAPIVAQAIASRYPVIICDEHQDADADQHEIILGLAGGGAITRIFGDPMQRIYGGTKPAEVAADKQRWEELKRRASAVEQLNHPHRWASTSPTLGRWLLQARSALEAGYPVDLRRGLPSTVKVLPADNVATGYGKYLVTTEQGRPIRSHVGNANSTLVLTRQNDHARALRPFFNRTLPIWEGHVRDALSELVSQLNEHTGNAGAVARATIRFVQSVAVGFPDGAGAARVISEVDSGCIGKARGKPVQLQALAGIILETPDCRGVAGFLRAMDKLIRDDPQFQDIAIDHYAEWREAQRLDQYAAAEEAFAEISRRRTMARPMPPPKAISTIHKAKGLEREDVVLMPVDGSVLRADDVSRCLLYVALSRATHSLTLVMSPQNPSPLFRF